MQDCKYMRHSPSKLVKKLDLARNCKFGLPREPLYIRRMVKVDPIQQFEPNTK